MRAQVWDLKTIVRVIQVPACRHQAACGFPHDTHLFLLFLPVLVYSALLQAQVALQPPSSS